MNVGSGTECSISELLAMVQRIADNELSVERLGPWPNDIRAIRADVTRLASEFGFAAATTLHDGLEETVRWFKEAR